MDNTKYLALPIKSLNNNIKFKLQEEIDCFIFESVGCNFKGMFFDFKVTKLLNGYELYEDIGQNNDIIIHINQINREQEILLCVIGKSTIKGYILNEDFYHRIEGSLSFQHKGNYFQLHCPYKTIKESCKCIIILQ